MSVSNTHVSARTIETFRRFNRLYTRLLGLFNRKLLDGPLSLAEARALYEIVAAPGVSAADLSHVLGMDRGQLSRLLNRLIKDGLIERHGEPGGRKVLPLHPTAEGRALLAELEAAADKHAATLFGPMGARENERLRVTLQQLETMLAGAGPQSAARDQGSGVTIRESRPGDLGWIITRHAEYYHREHGFDAEFEKYVLLSLAEYVKKDPAGSRVWIAEHDGAPAGSVGIVQLEGNRAQMRWLLVEGHARGLGVGRLLVEQALTFCRERGYDRVLLWTLEMLHPARALYASFGFTIAETGECLMGGQEMVEECWTLDLRPEGDQPSENNDALVFLTGRGHGHID
ncbi:bifunctional helix-turn-helix transcriptional regulator/GNAT family N-acetyltransferase [Oceanidesulfovibrio marinus]|uniref:MarR family transcriptional regulator n=1 Tax=Oceanidesulfovibrio marinus TaxID=370038 RepID=A0ABX6NJE0_9BACT|nr:GNAT family N-acetyltransferase [Oceanidesulfovibrio marinus]QJT10788.1 MarR family transcriptional regulator [Oceanidesulfovibrio marinus]